jgi:DNA-binding PadR family transcriptional regulator
MILICIIQISIELHGAARMPRLKPHAFHILAALADGDSHGSAIARSVLQATDGDVQLWPVTLYRTLDELVSGGMIAELEESDERPAGASRRRRYYRLTAAGAESLAAEAERLESIARAARRSVEEGQWGG